MVFEGNVASNEYDQNVAIGEPVGMAPQQRQIQQHQHQHQHYHVHTHQHHHFLGLHRSNTMPNPGPTAMFPFSAGYQPVQPNM